MGAKASSKSGLFLIELIIVILFFSIASAVCVQLFVRSHLISTQSEELTQSVNVSQSAAACIQQTKGDIDRTASLLGGVVESDKVVVYYDKDWNVCEGSEAAYRMELSITQQEDMLTCDSVVIKSFNDKEIYQVTQKKYLAPA